VMKIELNPKTCCKTIVKCRQLLSYYEVIAIKSNAKTQVSLC